MEFFCTCLGIKLHFDWINGRDSWQCLLRLKMRNRQNQNLDLTFLEGSWLKKKAPMAGLAGYMAGLLSVPYRSASIVRKGRYRCCQHPVPHGCN